MALLTMSIILHQSLQLSVKIEAMYFISLSCLVGIMVTGLSKYTANEQEM